MRIGHFFHHEIAEAGGNGLAAERDKLRHLLGDVLGGGVVDEFF
jgi:hypothetical protein